MNINNLIRNNIKDLTPYSSARDEFMGEAILLDANESPYNRPFNRYPDPLQNELRDRLSGIYGLPGRNIFIGNGSDEAIDLLIRVFCEPANDRVIIIEPSYGMYRVCADINNVSVDPVLLNADFSLNAGEILDAVSKDTRLVFLCSPNNPTSNLLAEDEIVEVLQCFGGIVVVDEAYVDFCPGGGLIHLLEDCRNLVLLRTLSKAWGMAGIRVGVALGDQEIMAYMNKVKYPYNLNILSQEKAVEMLADPARKEYWVKRILDEKKRLIPMIHELAYIEEVFPSDANFLLVRVNDPDGLYDFLNKNGVIVRNRSRLPHCRGCLRITVGTPGENDVLIGLLKEWKK